MSHEIPNAVRIFFSSLVVGVASSWLAFRLAFFLAGRFFENVEPMLLAALSVVFAGAVGIAAAVTAGVLSGKRAHP